MLRSLVGDNIKSWETKLSQAEFAHNHANNRSLGFSPFYVVYGIVPRGPLDLTVMPDKSRLHGQAVDFVDNLQLVHQQAQTHLETTKSSYKKDADKHRREINFQAGDLVWVVLTKDRFPAHEYNKLKSRKIGPVEVIHRINANAYKLRLPDHIRTSDVFNVKHLFPYHGENEVPDSGTNLSLPGET